MATSSSKHVVIYRGKHIDNNESDFADTTPLEYNLCDDDPKMGERTGWGMPVSLALKKRMIGAYKKELDEVNDVFKKLPDIVEGIDIRKLKESVNPDNEIVGGVYGKETILSILAQPGCEGILYINCIYDNRKSIVLQGLDKDGNPITSGTNTQGRRLEGKEFFEFRLHQVDSDPTPILGDELIYEVKGGSITRSELGPFELRDTVEGYVMAFFDKNR